MSDINEKFFFDIVHLIQHNSCIRYSKVLLQGKNSFSLSLISPWFHLLMFWMDILWVSTFYVQLSIYFFIIFFLFEQDQEDGVILVFVFFSITILSHLSTQVCLNKYFLKETIRGFYDDVKGLTHLRTLLLCHIVIQLNVGWPDDPFVIQIWYLNFTK